MIVQINSSGVSLAVGLAKKNDIGRYRFHENIHGQHWNRASHLGVLQLTIHTRAFQKALFTCWIKAGSDGGNPETNLLLLAISTRESLRLKVVDCFFLLSCTLAVHIEAVHIGTDWFQSQVMIWQIPKGSSARAA